MAVTYSADLDDDVSRVRFWLRDTVLDAGPLPDEANFADSEIEQLVELEGSWQQAVAAGFEVLASAWSQPRTPVFSREDRSESWKDIAARYEKLAMFWRDKYGSPVLSGAAISVGVITTAREDGYSDATTETDYTI